MEERNESESHSTCFLCLKPSQLPNNLKENPISVRTIHRYLNLPQFKNGGGGGGGAGSGFGGDFSQWWWMCEECCVVTGRLTYLCEQLEVIQMKVNHSLEMFYSKLLEGEEEMGEGVRVEFSKRRGRCDDPSYKAFHKVRTQTLEQCERSLRHARRLSVHLKKVQVCPPPVSSSTLLHLHHPQPLAYQQSHSTTIPCHPASPSSLVVIKTEPEPVNEPEEEEDFVAPQIHLGSYQNSIPSGPPINSPPPNCSRDSLLLKFLKGPPSPPIQPPHQIQNHHQVFPVVAVAAPSIIANQPTFKPPTFKPPFKSILPLEPAKCSICPPEDSKPEVALFHQEEYHLDELFPPSSYLHPGIPPSEYKAYCEHVVHTELLLSNATPKSTPFFHYTCLYCPASSKVHFDSWRHLRTHLLHNHRNMLAGKLWELQRCTQPEELHNIRLPPLVDKSVGTLLEVERLTPEVMAQAPVPPVIRRTRVTSGSTGLDLSGTGKCCPDCGAEFARRNLVKRHQTESCPYRRDKSKSSRRPTECPDCGVTFLHPGSFYHHRKEKHPHKAAVKPPSSSSSSKYNYDNYL